MTTTPTRRLLPLLATPRHGSRSRMTCHYRCADACDQPVPNRSGNPEFRDIAEQVLARRSLLKVGAGAGALTVTGFASALPSVAAEVTGRGGAGSWDFTPVTPNTADRVTVPAGFKADVLISWGDRVEKGAPTFDVNRQTPEAAAKQFGYNNDYVGVLPHPTKKRRGLLVVNHEYTDEQLMFPTGAYDEQTIKRISMASHGMSVVEIRRDGKPGSWRRVQVGKAPLNRRLHVGSDFRLVGPAAGDERLRTSADPTGTRVQGTFNNCAGGLTPWGTVLSGEENFHGYFEGTQPEQHQASYARYGITSGSGRGWAEVDPRFSMDHEPNEPYRHGWIVELDPTDPTSTPRKHTMLGRMKHEGANVTLAPDGRAVVYMGDDERGDYIYRFVSAGRYDASGTRAARRNNMRLLLTGTLSVARFDGDGTEDERYDGTGRWIRLASDTESFVAGMSVADVLLDTRLAADQVGATRMDRPEDIEVNPVNGRVYCALTNNSQRGSTYEPDEANPLTSSMVRDSLDAPLRSASGNRNGYILEMTPGNDNHAGRDFQWSLMLVCGDPEAPETYFAGYPKDQVSPISCPDNVAFDAIGNLWISTDGNALGSNDGLFRVPVKGSRRGKVEQFLTVPVGAEACGPFITEDQRSIFIAPQHPGETDGATFENQSSTWPFREGFPRPSVVVVRRS